MEGNSRWYGFPPEERLFGEILSQALADIQKPKYREKTWQYFISQDTETPTSFLSICRLLNIDEDNILTLVKKFYFSGRPLTTNALGKFSETF